MASTPSSTPITDAQLEQLSELLRIESVSSDGAHPAELRAAAEWVAALVGGAEVLTSYRNPIVDGTIRASVADAPTVLAYGHYDVQSPGSLDLWASPPFEPTVRDGWLYARGVSDDKGNLWALLRAALDLQAEGRLPVNVRVLCDGEEEVGGLSVVDHLATLEDTFAAAIIFDGHMVDAQRPAITTGLRGLVGCQVRLRSGERELHSGLYGGAAANAVDDLAAVLATVIGHDADFADGIAPVSAAERHGWAELQSGAELLAEAGARPKDPTAAAEAYDRIWARPSLTVHSVGAGDPQLHKTSISVEAAASLSLRLAPGQEPEPMWERLQARLHAACPEPCRAGAGAVATVAAGLDRSLRPRAAGGLRRDRAGHGRTAPGDPQRRLDSHRCSAGGAWRAHHPERVRYGRRRDPLTQRGNGAAPPGVGDAVGSRSCI